jgi:metal-responsive CopG/Arc/MetJ family transcriptional regulator
MPSETVYLPDDHMKTVDSVMADTDADNRSQALQRIIEAYDQ